MVHFNKAVVNSAEGQLVIVVIGGNMELRLHRCGSGDLRTLRALSVDTFIRAFGHLNTPEDMEAYCARVFSEDSLQRQMETMGTAFWFLYADGELAGYMKLNTGDAQTEDMGEDALEIERIYVCAAFQGQGLGGYLLEQAVETASAQSTKSVWLGVWEHNTRAVKFYEAHGFRRKGTHNFFLGSDRQTDIIMQRTL